MGFAAMLILYDVIK